MIPASGPGPSLQSSGIEMYNDFAVGDSLKELCYNQDNFSVDSEAAAFVVILYNLLTR